MNGDDLLQYYERELNVFRQYAREYAARYPRIAGQLQLGGDACGDPHVERLIQAVALMSARLSKRLDDSYPQFTESLLETLYPHYLRPFPSCAIAQVAAGTEPSAGATTLPRGTELRSAPVQGIPCMFRTTCDVAIAPVAVSAARFESGVGLPLSVPLPAEVTSGIFLDIESTAPGLALDAAGPAALRIYLDGDPSFCATLRDALFMHAVCAHVQATDGPWQRLPATPLAAAGFAEDEALVPTGARSHPAYRLLTEYFAFPDKFNFVDIDLRALAQRCPGAQRISLHVALADIAADADAARLLATLSPANLRLFCTPVVNLFAKPAVPFILTHQSADYPVIADVHHAWAYDVHAIDSVRMAQGSGTAVADVMPFYAAHLGGGEPGKRYWIARRDEALAALSPGHELRIAFVDKDCVAAAAGKAKVSLELTCSNRDLPRRLPHGAPGGDLHPLPGRTGPSLRLLRRPTLPYRFGVRKDAHWRLVSQLTLNHRSLVREGAPAFRDMLSLFDLAQSASTQKQIGGIAGLAQESATAWMRAQAGAALVSGVRVIVHIDEAAFVGTGLHAFSQVLDHYFGLYVQINQFTELVVVSSQTAKELIHCKPRNGNQQIA